jgi:hypothetical protein
LVFAKRPRFEATRSVSVWPGILVGLVARRVFPNAEFDTIGDVVDPRVVVGDPLLAAILICFGGRIETSNPSPRKAHRLSPFLSYPALVDEY